MKFLFVKGQLITKLTMQRSRSLAAGDNEDYCNTDGRMTNNHNCSNGCTRPSQTTLTTRPANEKPSDTSSDDSEAVCQICFDENAYQDYGARQCSKCKQFLCQKCYKGIEKASQENQRHDYGEEHFGFYFRLRCDVYSV
ncbi:MAG: hypothetical protein RL012_581 [Bacteroidota bacterium]